MAIVINRKFWEGSKEGTLWSCKIRMLYWAIFVVFSLAYATNIPKGLIEQVRWLADNNFQSFSNMLILLGGDLTEEEATEILSNDNFEPLFNFFEGNVLNCDEVQHLLFLANKHLVTGDKMNEILDTYFKYVTESKLPFPNLIVYGHVHSALKDYLANRQLGIEMKEDKVELEGWEVNETSKQLTLQLFKSLTFFSTSISIKNLLIDDSIFEQIQSLLHSNLKSLHFENCPILNPNKYFQLNRLISFKFSNCYCNNFIEMLGTISRDTLIKLDISNNAFTQPEIDTLTILFKEFKKLESLNVSSRFPYSLKGPKFPGDLINLVNLKSLKASGNLNINQLSRILSDSIELYNLEYLDISHNSFSDLNCNIFSCNLSKFIALKELNISVLFLNPLSTSIGDILKMQSLKELSIDVTPPSNIQVFVEDNTPRTTPLKITSYVYLKSEFLPKINLFHRISLYGDILNHTSIDLLPKQFETSELSLYDHIFTESPRIVTDFFSRFKKLKRLEFSQNDSFQLEYLNILLNNNPIEILEIMFNQNCTQFTNLIAIIGNRKFKSLKIERITDQFYQSESSYFDKFLPSISQVELWKELEIFDCGSFSLQSVFYLLTNISCKKLVQIKLRNIYDDCEIENISTCLPSVRIIELSFMSSNVSSILKFLSVSMKLFPFVTELKILIKTRELFTLPDFSSLLNLRYLYIEARLLSIPNEFVNQLKELPFLNKLIIFEITQNKNSQFVFGKHFNFPSLVFSLIVVGNEQLRMTFSMSQRSILGSNSS